MYVMNFRHFLEMLEFNLWHFGKISEIHYIKNARNYKLTFDLRWALVKCLVRTRYQKVKIFDIYLRLEESDQSLIFHFG